MKLTIKPATKAERMYIYKQSSQISNQCGLIGYLRADFGSDGLAFFSSWNDYSADLKTPEFKAEFDDVINALRFDDAYQGLLSGRDSLKKFCRSHPESSFGNEREYGVRADTGNYAYLMRLNPNKDEYNLYCFCYYRAWLNRHLHNAENGIRFIDPNYNEKFRICDGDKIKIHYAWGEDEIKTCRYIDAYHLEIGDNLYHIAEFAEKLAASGHGCEPLAAEEELNEDFSMEMMT